MAAGASNYLENARLNWLKGTAFPTAPTSTYVALYTAAPTDAGGGTEATGGAYARVAIADTGWSAISGTGPEQISNAAAVTFPTPTASWGTVVAIGLLDAATAGNLLYWGTTTSTVIGSGVNVSIAIGGLVVSED